MKRLRDFVSTKTSNRSTGEHCNTTVSESTWLGKGFAIGQQARFNSARTKVNSLVSRLQNTTDRGRSSDDLSIKTDSVLESNLLLGLLLQTLSELESYTIAVAVSDVLLNDDTSAVLKREIAKLSLRK